MRFEFATANRIIFGPGRFLELGNLAGNLGRKALVVTGSHALRASGKLQVLEDSLTASGLSYTHVTVSTEPDVESVQQSAALARKEGCNLVIGVGGGSAIDLAKAVAGLLTNDGALLDFLEVIGKGQALRNKAAPMIAVPTTAGTGAEVTANAVIRDPQTRQKISLRSPFLLPALAVIDPELTYSMSPQITAQSGLDALVHLVEGYTSKRAQPLTDPLCRDGIVCISRSLVRAYADGRDQTAREDMALASLLGGMVLANAGLGAVHGAAAVIGGSYPAPHGMACACLLPYVFESNVRRLRAEQPVAFHRYVEVSEWLVGRGQTSDDGAIEAGLAFIRDLNGRLKVPSLSQFGVRREDLAEIAQKAAQASSSKANAVSFSPEEFEEILGKALV